MPKQPLIVRGEEPLPESPKWDEINEIHAYGTLDREHFQFVHEAQITHKLDIVAKDAGAQKSMDPGE